MDTEDESATYLNYFNDPTTTNNYLISNNVELADSFSFAEIEGSDWPTENFPVLTTSLISECNDVDTTTGNIELFDEAEGTEKSKNVDEEIELQPLQQETNSNFLLNENATLVKPSNGQSSEFELNTPIETINENIDYFSVKTKSSEQTNLMEKYVNNDDPNGIQLFNTDGSLITIDKSIFSSLNATKEVCNSNNKFNKVLINYEEYYYPLIANKCKICSFLSETVKEMKIHLTENHAQMFSNKTVPNKIRSESSSLLKTNKNEDKRKLTIYLCHICNLALSDEGELKKHMIQNHEITTVPVEEKMLPTKKITLSGDNGKKSLSTLSSMLLKQLEKARKKVKCRIKGCYSRFARDDLKLKHENCHVGENKKQFKCTECDEKFSVWRICSNHLWKCHKIDMGLLSCPMCNNFKSNTAVRIMNHMAIHNEERPFLCGDCGKRYKTFVQLKNHEVIHRKPEDIPNSLMPRQCEICQRDFSNSKCLKKHIESVHEQYKPFICNICGHKTTRKAMLELHLRQHTGAKPHRCQYCEYRTADHNCLRKHVMTHMGLRKYKCPYCTYTAIQTASYKKHMLNRHPGKSGTYSCSYCTYTSINVTRYTAHLKKHEAESKDNHTRQNGH